MEVVAAPPNQERKPSDILNAADKKQYIHDSCKIEIINDRRKEENVAMDVVMETSARRLNESSILSSASLDMTIGYNEIAVTHAYA